MGTGNSKNSPDERMRLKMENGFDDDDDDIEPFGLSEQEKAARSKSNLSCHTQERFQNEDEDYFNKIYNKNPERSLTSLNGSSTGVRSAPAGRKKEKDPEVAAAIAELEETFKVLGDEPLTDSSNNSAKNPDLNTLLEAPIQNPESPLAYGVAIEISNSNGGHLSSGFGSENSINDIPEVISSENLHYDRNLISRAGDFHNGIDQNSLRRPSKMLECNGRFIGSSEQSRGFTHSSSGSSTHVTMNSRGSEPKTFILPNHSNSKRGRNHNSQSILMQQKKELQRRQPADGISSVASSSSSKSSEFDLNQESWTYEPPKIDGFDVKRFKEINSKEIQRTIVPLILREEEDKGYYSRSPDIPAYTKDELELIASLEREVY